MSKVYVFLADGFEEVEGLTAVDLLRRAGVDVVTVSINGNRIVTGSHRIPVAADVLFEEIEFSDADILLLPGGMPGTTHLAEHEGLGVLLKNAAEKGTGLAAICAAPTVFGGLGLLRGRTAVCYPGCEGKLTGAAIGNGNVEVDGNITTSRGVGTAIDFALELVKQLCGEEKSEQIAESILYKRP